MEYLPEALRILLATLGYGALHSLLASRAAKAAARKQFGPLADRLYRLIFNAVAVVSLIPLLAILGRNLGPAVFVVPMPWAAVVAIGQIAAILLLGLSFLQSDPAYFIGLRQLGNEDAVSRLVTTGGYAIVRHPIYSTALLILWCFPIQTIGTLAFAVGVTVYILIGSELEERRLISEFGEDYIRYRFKVARLIPYLF
jgi:protein-S-isoprenylcysteine O-methyltransferase Ste14